MVQRLGEYDPKRGRGGRVWRRICATILIPGVVCAWPPCQQEIDLTLPATHRWSGTVDHIIELEDGGHPTARWNLQPMHRRCNTIKENKKRKAKWTVAAQTERRPSRGISGFGQSVRPSQTGFLENPER
ncbi:HNH endonuclease signature motif containing protein [Arthrobacter sp. HLT1-21]